MTPTLIGLPDAWADDPAAAEEPADLLPLEEPLPLDEQAASRTDAAATAPSADMRRRWGERGFKLPPDRWDQASAAAIKWGQMQPLNDRTTAMRPEQGRGRERPPSL